MRIFPMILSVTLFFLVESNTHAGPISLEGLVKVRDHIGSGYHADVSLWRDHSGFLWAVKCLRHPDDTSGHFLTEIPAMDYTSSLGLSVGISTFFLEEEECLAQTFADGGDLYHAFRDDPGFLEHPGDPKNLALFFLLGATFLSRAKIDTHSGNIAYSNQTKHWSIIDPKHGSDSLESVLGDRVDSWNAIAHHFLDGWSHANTIHEVTDPRDSNPIKRRQSMALPLFIQTTAKILEIPLSSDLKTALNTWVPEAWSPTVDHLEAHYLLYLLHLVRDSPYPQVRGPAAELAKRILNQSVLLDRVRPFISLRKRTRYFLENFGADLSPESREKLKEPVESSLQIENKHLSEHVAWYTNHCVENWRGPH